MSYSDFVAGVFSLSWPILLFWGVVSALHFFTRPGRTYRHRHRRRQRKEGP